jgi:hypothetical protein
MISDLRGMSEVVARDFNLDRFSNSNLQDDQISKRYRVGVEKREKGRSNELADERNER